MKKLIVMLATCLLIISACGQNDEKTKEASQDKSASEKKDKAQSQKKEKDTTKDQEKDNKQQNEQQNEQQTNSKSDEQNDSSAENENKQNQKSQQVNINNITDRATLESVIYGNYAEIDKIKAYNSAVSNGVIPQGNVMEGPASAAYESSLRVESGAEQSIYDQNAQSQAKAPEEDVNAEINAAQTEDQYIDALRKKYNGGLSSAELQTKYAIEQGYYDGDEAEQQAIYDEIERREADIEAGKYDHYKQ
ncbi:hypothetical protein ACY2DA_10805 [Staphylococcus simulans]